MTAVVSAVVATYNRWGLLCECLDALMRQTRKPDHIIVVDNASTDGTAGQLSARYPSVEVVTLSANAGSSGGVHAGMKRAVELQSDWVWVMDDDAEPVDDALQRLCETIHDPGLAAVACLKTDAQGAVQYHHRGYFTFDALPRHIIRPITRPQLQAGEPFEIDHASFVGVMVRGEAIRSVGYPDRRLFLQFDDVEYCIRLREHGKVLLVPASRILHKEALPAGMKRKHLLGLPYESLPFESVWKRYFVYRNFVWLSRRYGKRRVWGRLQLVGLFLFLCLMTAFCESDRCKRIVLLWHAFRDGYRGVFDNSKPWRILYGEQRNIAPPD